MNDRFIYIVGKPDPQSESLESIHQLGFKAGVLLDSQASLKHPEVYDCVVTVNFAALDSELPRLAHEELNIVGLVCTYENYIISKAKLGTYFQVPSLSLASAAMSTDKSLMRQAFMEADPTITPNFTTVDSLHEALAFATKKGYPLILKPTNLVKSLLVLRCNNEKELRENFTYASGAIKGLYEKYNIYDREPQLMIEEYIVGKTCSIAAFVDEQGTPHFCDGIVALTSAQDINVADNYLYSRRLPASFSDSLTAQLFAVAEKGIRALNMRSTAAHVELIYNDTEVKLIEIGARIGGYRPRMYQYSYGTDLPEQEVRLAIGEQPQLHGTFKAYSAVYELFPNTEGVFEGIVGNPNTDLYTYYAVKAHVGQRVGPARNGYKAALIVIVVHTDIAQFTAICASIDALRVQVTA